MKTKSAAILTVFDAAKMSAKGRRDIVKWLQCQIKTLKNDSKQLAPRWTVRYLYR